LEGFNSGLNAVEKMPWWRKVGAVISRAVRERDELREQVKTIKAEKETWLEKAKGLIDKGARAAKRLREVEPELKAAKRELSVTQPKAREADKLREKTEGLESALSSERAKNQHLEATVEALNKRLEPEKAPEAQKGKHRAMEDGLSL
jgi:predicted RNase H-like nuclease (RuvC/YqgF family)